jgi:hypothetical protein
MKTQTILIAAVALLLGTEAALIKPAPGTSVDFKIPGTNNRKLLPNLGNYLLYMNNGHTGSILGDFNNLHLYLDSNNALAPVQCTWTFFRFLNGMFVNMTRYFGD